MTKKVVTPDQLVKNLTMDFEALFRGIATEAQERMIRKAPVNTGALRASIQAGVNQEVIEFNPEKVDPSGQATAQANAAIIKGAKDGDKINIVVGAPYGKEIEEGSSTQAPTGFILTTGEELDAIVKTVSTNLGKYRS